MPPHCRCPANCKLGRSSGGKSLAIAGATSPRLSLVTSLPLLLPLLLMPRPPPAAAASAAAVAAADWIRPPPPRTSIVNNTMVLCEEKYRCGGINAAEAAAASPAAARECSCHPRCALFDTCCADVRPPDWRRQRLSEWQYSCAPVSLLTAGSKAKVGGYQEVFVITACPNRFVATTIGDRCAHPLNLTNSGVLSALISEDDTGITYRNMFCAYCHGANMSRVVEWKPSNVCTQNYVAGTKACVLGYAPPASYSAIMPDCRWSTSMTCPLDAPQHASQACDETPTSYVYDFKSSRAYRNWNCSLCYNNDNYTSDWRCVEPQRSFGISSKPTNDFGVLLVQTDSCPQRFSDRMDASDKDFWRRVCPDVTFDDGSSDGCDAIVNEEQLVSLFRQCRDSCEYNFTAHHAWLRLNATFVACTLCRLSFFTGEALCHASAPAGALTLSNRTYSPPFFWVATAAANSSCAVCSAHDLETDGSAAAAAAAPCHTLPPEVSVALMSLSLSGLAAYAAVYAATPSMRNLPGQIILNESLAFFAAFLVFLLRPFAAAAAQRVVCMAAGAFVHYFFLAGFAWTALYAVEVVRALNFQAQRARLTGSRRVPYLIAGWLLPAAVVAAGVATDLAAPRGSPYRPAYGGPQCFMSSAVGQRVFFVGPLATLLSVCVSTYVYMIAKLALIGNQTKMVRDSRREKVLLAAKLLFALGVAWVFAIAASVTGDCTLTYLFTLLNAGHGVVVFAVFVLNSRAGGQLVQRLRRQRSTSSHSSAGSSSSVATLQTREFEKSSVAGDATAAAPWPPSSE